MQFSSIALRRVQAFDGPTLDFARRSLRLDVTISDPGPSGDELAAACRLVARWLAQLDLASDIKPPAAPNGAQPHGAVGPALAFLLENLLAHTGFKPPVVKVGAGKDPRRIVVACEYREGRAGSAAARYAVLLLNAALQVLGEQRTETEVVGLLGQFRQAAAPDTPSTSAIMSLLDSRGVPWVEIDPGRGMLECGWGVHHRRLLRTLTDRTAEIAYEVSSRKNLANAVLAQHGVPVPPQRTPADAAEAVAAAHAVGFPVVVKPAHTDKGVGVTTNLKSDDEVRAAFGVAARHGQVVLEKHIPGDTYRLIVIGGRLVAATRFTRPSVVGDGRRTVSALVEEENARRRAQKAAGQPSLSPLVLESESERLLKEQQLSLDAVPEKGAMVILRSAAHGLLGGPRKVVTELVNPLNARMAVRAAEAVGLDVAGLDFLTTDISRPWTETGGAVCEINPSPAFAKEPVALEAFLDAVIPSGGDGRIPVLAFLGGSSEEASSAAAAAFARAGHTVSEAGAAGVRIAGDLLDPRRSDTKFGARMALVQRQATAAVLQLAPEDIVRNGLAFDRCDAAVVLGLTPSQVERQAAALLLSHADRAILNGADPVVQRLGAVLPHDRVVWLDSSDPMAAAAAATGG